MASPYIIVMIFLIVVTMAMPSIGYSFPSHFALGTHSFLSLGGHPDTCTAAHHIYARVPAQSLLKLSVSPSYIGDSSTSVQISEKENIGKVVRRNISVNKTSSESETKRRSDDDIEIQKLKLKSQTDSRLGNLFTSLVITARTRDKHSLVATLKVLEKDKLFLAAKQKETNKSLRLYDVLLRACSRCDLVEYADRILEHMLSIGRNPTLATAGAMLEALRVKGDVDSCLNLSKKLLERGLNPGPVSLNIVIGALSEADRYDEAINLIESADREPWNCVVDIVGYNTVLGAAARRGKVEVSERVIAAMLLADVIPDVITANSLIHCKAQAGDLKSAQNLFEEVIRGEFYGVKPARNTYNIGINAYIKDGNFVRSMELLEEIKTGGLTTLADTYNTILSALLKDGKSDQAIELFERDIGNAEGRVRPSRITYNIMLEVYRNLGENEVAQKLYRQMRSNGLTPDCHTLSSLVRIQDDSGGVYRALQGMIKHRIQPNTILLNNVIWALGQHNDAIGACQVFDQISRAGLRPDAVSYNCLMNALVRRGSKPVKSLPEDYKKAKLPLLPVDSTVWSSTKSPKNALPGTMEKHMLSFCGIEAAFELFTYIKNGETFGAPKPPRIEADEVTYTTLLTGVVHSWGERWVEPEIGYPTSKSNRGSIPPGNPVTSNHGAISKNTRDSGEIPLTENQDSVKYGDKISKSTLDSGETGINFLAEDRVSAENKTSSEIPVSEEKWDKIMLANPLSELNREDTSINYPDSMRSWVDLSAENKNIFEKRDQNDSSLERKRIWQTRQEICLKLLNDAMNSGVAINGEMCNAVIQGFGTDIEGGISIWQKKLRPLLLQESNASTSETSTSKRQSNLFKGYTGLLYVCGRAARPDVAVKIVYAMTKEGISVNPEVSSAYFNARRVEEDLSGPDSKAGKMKMYLRHQLEELLIIECGGVNEKKMPNWMDDMPKIRIKWG